MVGVCVGHSVHVVISEGKLQSEPVQGTVSVYGTTSVDALPPESITTPVSQRAGSLESGKGQVESPSCIQEPIAVGG